MGDPRKFPVDYLMKIIGEQGHHVHIRFDPLRTENRFTIIIDEMRLTDTDVPRNALADWYQERYLCGLQSEFDTWETLSDEALAIVEEDST